MAVKPVHRRMLRLRPEAHADTAHDVRCHSILTAAVQVVMHHLLQDYFHQDPQNRVPHIPSTIIHPPVPKQIQGNLCYQSRYLSDEPVHIREEDIHATAVALLEAAQQLEGDADARQIQKANAGTGSSHPVRKYFLKRNYSGKTAHDPLQTVQMLKGSVSATL